MNGNEKATGNQAALRKLDIERIRLLLSRARSVRDSADTAKAAQLYDLGQRTIVLIDAIENLLPEEVTQ